MYYQEKVKEINAKLKILNDSEKIIVWPCGGHTREMFGGTDLPIYLEHIEFVDNSRAGEIYMGRAIKSEADVNWKQIDAVIISSLQYQAEIERKLRDNLHFLGKIITFYNNETREFYELYNAYHGIAWGDEVHTWEEAESLCEEGYCGKTILKSCIETIQNMKNNENVPNYFLISHILGLYIKHKKVIVVDYGGALANEYYRNKKFLDELNIKYEWAVVDLSQYIEYGVKNLQNQQLKFFNNLKELEDTYGNANYVIYARSSLQYIKDAYHIIEQFAEFQAKEIIIDDTPMAEHEHIVIQKVRDYLYEAKFAVRILDENKIVESMNIHHYILMEADKTVNMRFSDFDANYKRLVFKRH